MKYYRRSSTWISRKKYKKKYHKYLLSPEWVLVKKRLFEERGRQCERCGSRNYLQVHHKHYRNIFKERNEDLEILCNKCHEQEHDITN